MPFKKKEKINKNVKKVIAAVMCLLGITFLAVGVSTMILLSAKLNTIEVDNIYLDKSVKEEVLVQTYKEIYAKNLTPVFYNNYEDAFINAKNFPTSFKGKLTHYGPDCEKCGGTLGCNGQKATNGNIYYDDKEYGTLRIVAASKDIPCGSIIRIHSKAYDQNGMLAIVLDRGVSGNTIDLLKVSQKTKSPVRTQNNIKFDIIRYGY